MDTLPLFNEHLRAGKIAHLHGMDQLVLSFEQRQKARQRATLSSGQEIGIQLQRGTILRGGDYLRSSNGDIIRVVAAPEFVSIATSQDPLKLARAAYHLGNRHVHLEVAAGNLRYLADHVLDHMVRSLGLRLAHDRVPFEPESGAYSHGHSQDHSHDHDHGPEHGHSHEH